MEFTNKVCVVTGGANGIGRCIAETFIANGAFVAIVDTDEESGMKLCEKYKGGRLFFHRGDITEKEQLITFSNLVIGKFGKVDFLINNACVGRRGILSGCSYEDFNYVLSLGVTAPYMLAQLFLPFFAKGAAIVNISSTRAYMSQADTESYTVAKGGISALTHALAVSLSGRVRVNCISPGWIDTGAYQKLDSYTENHSQEDHAQHPSGRVGKPEDIAEMALFLCSGKAGFITGENITVDGGMTKQMIYHADGGWTYRID